MKIRVCKPDNLVEIDGVVREIDCSGLDPRIKVIRLDTVEQDGEVEFMDYDEATGRPLRTPKPREITVSDARQIPGFPEVIVAFQNWVEPPPPPPGPTEPPDLVSQFLDDLRANPDKLQKLVDFVNT